MTEAERIDRAYRAETAYREFIEPMLDEMRNAYADRIVEHANGELRRDVRADKITALSIAHKILTTLDAGMLEIMRDGDMAKRNRTRAEEIEKMTEPQRRIFGLVPSR